MSPGGLVVEPQSCLSHCPLPTGEASLGLLVSGGSCLVCMFVRLSVQGLGLAQGARDLVGLVTQQTLLEGCPVPSTTLAIWQGMREALAERKRW